MTWGMATDRPSDDEAVPDFTHSEFTSCARMKKREFPRWSGLISLELAWKKASDREKGEIIFDTPVRLVTFPTRL